MATEQSNEPATASQAADLWNKRFGQSFFGFIAEFSKESDRAAVILVGARLDYLLGELLSRFLLPNTGSHDELLDNDRAMGTFSTRIHAAYRLGLIDGEFARALHIFRRLRNTFAHETAGGSFDHGPSRDRVQELVAPVAHAEVFANLRALYFKDKTESAADFFTAAAVLVGRLEVACGSVTRITASTTFVLSPRGWKATDERAP